MNTLDPAGEWLRISEHYRQLSDSELLVLARQRSQLTDFAQQSLAQELYQRRLKVEPDLQNDAQDEEAPPAPPLPEAPSDPSYDEDRRLVRICTVWSLPVALQVQTLLDRAGIPFFMGKEKATGVNAVTSNFVSGVDVEIMNIGLPWARQAMQNYTPANEPPEKREEEPGEGPVRCPRCHSTEVVFEGLTKDPATVVVSAPNYQWACDSCGHQWEDNGIVMEE